MKKNNVVGHHSNTSMFDFIHSGANQAGDPDGDLTGFTDIGSFENHPARIMLSDYAVERVSSLPGFSHKLIIDTLDNCGQYLADSQKRYPGLIRLSQTTVFDFVCWFYDHGIRFYAYLRSSNGTRFFVRLNNENPSAVELSFLGIDAIQLPQKATFDSKRFSEDNPQRKLFRLFDDYHRIRRSADNPFVTFENYKRYKETGVLEDYRAKAKKIVMNVSRSDVCVEKDKPTDAYTKKANIRSAFSTSRYFLADDTYFMFFPGSYSTLSPDEKNAYATLLGNNLRLSYVFSISDEILLQKQRAAFAKGDLSGLKKRSWSSKAKSRNQLNIVVKRFKGMIPEISKNHLFDEIRKKVDEGKILESFDSAKSYAMSTLGWH